MPYDNATPTPEAPKPSNKGETSSLNRFESRPEFWESLFGNKSEGTTSGSSNSGSNQAQIFADMISGRTTGIPTGNTFTVDTGTPIFPDLFTVEDTGVPPSEIPEVSQGNTGAPEAQKGTETVQKEQPRTEADELRESRAKWKPLEGSRYDENYHVVVDNPEAYKKALEEDKAAIDKKLARPERLEVNERRALEQRKTWIGKTLDTVIRVGEKIVEVGKPVIRAAERAGRHL